MKPFILEVGLQILHWQEKDIQPTVSSLVKTLDGRITRNEISQAIDYLYDLRMLIEEYKNVGEKTEPTLRIFGWRKNAGKRTQFILRLFGYYEAYPIWQHGFRLNTVGMDFMKKIKAQVTK